MFSMKEFGQRVSNLRKVRNLTQDELAYRVNVNKGHISRIERGTVACSLELLIDLSNELHTSTDFLLTGIGPSNDFAKEEIDTAISIWMRIPKKEFERWYRSQSRHRTAADRERDREIEAQTISIPEMAKLLGIPREKVYWILDCKKYRDCFVIERVADRRRITKTSFEIWLNSQSTYRLQEPVMEAHEEPPLELKCPKSGKYYSFQEIQDFYGVSRTTLVTWIREEGIPTIDVGRAKRVRKDVFDDVLKSKRKVEGDT